MYGLNTVAKQYEFWAKKEATALAETEAIKEYLKTI